MTDQTDDARLDQDEDVEGHRRLDVEEDGRFTSDEKSDDDVEGHMRIRPEPGLGG